MNSSTPTNKQNLQCIVCQKEYIGPERQPALVAYNVTTKEQIRIWLKNSQSLRYGVLLLLNQANIIPLQLNEIYHSANSKLEITVWFLAQP